MKNLIPAADSGAWRFVTPECRNYAVGTLDSAASTFSITVSDPVHYGVGRWEAEYTLASGWYDFSVVCHTDADMHDVYVLHDIYTDSNRTDIRDHAEHEERTADGWRFTDRIEVPENAHKCKTELWFKGYTGQVTWELPVITPAVAPAPREVRVAIGYMKPRAATLESNREVYTRIVDKCGAYNPDVILMSEGMYERGVDLTLHEKAESAEDGVMIRAMCEKAAQYHSYLIYNFHEKYEGEIYNSSLLIDREGKIAGRYFKTHLTVAELEMGMTPGREHPVFDVDFGRIGLLTCYDQYFPEPANELAKKGAEIVFIPTAGDAREKCHARALDGGFYFCVGGMNMENPYGWAPSRIIAPDGEILAQSGEDEAVVFAVIDLSRKVRRHWLSTGANMTEARSVYRFEKNPKSY